MAGQFWLGSHAAAVIRCSSGLPAASVSVLSGLSTRALHGAGLGSLAASDFLDAAQSSEDKCPQTARESQVQAASPYLGSHTASFLWHSLSEKQVNKASSFKRT